MWLGSTERVDFGVDAAKDRGFSGDLEFDALEKKRGRRQQYPISTQQTRLAANQPPLMFDQIDGRPVPVAPRIRINPGVEGINSYDAARNQLRERYCVFGANASVEKAPSVMCLDPADGPHGSLRGNPGTRPRVLQEFESLDTEVFGSCRT